MERRFQEVQDEIIQKDRLIKQLQQRKSRTKDMARGYSNIQYSRDKKNKYQTYTPNRTISSLDSNGSAAHVMDQMLGDLGNDFRPSRNYETKHRKRSNFCILFTLKYI